MSKRKKKKSTTLKTKTNFQSKFIESVEKAAKTANVEPYKVSLAGYRAALGDEAISHWELRKHGGFTQLKKLHFPEPIDIKDSYGAKLINRKVSKLDKKYGEKVYLVDAVSDVLSEKIDNTKFYLHKAKKLKKPTKFKRALVGVLSDTHFGKPIHRYEVPNNQYNWTIAARRAAMFFDQLVNYKLEHRKETRCIILLGGDIIEGLLHDIEDLDPLSTQFTGSLHILTQGLTYVARHFSSIEVHCTTGNHGRNKSRHKDRATMSKYDSLETLLYVAIKNSLKGYKNIDFNIPKTPFCDFKIFDHRFYLTHGDTVISSGNVGSNINIKSISNQINKLNASLKDHDEYKVVILGHVHTALSMHLDNGCELIVNGSMIGSDPYANSIGIFDSNAVQIMFEVTEKHAVGDLRKLRLDDADEESKFDTIISPYDGSL